jgi:MSHA biogenesis protein MshQ
MKILNKLIFMGFLVLLCQVETAWASACYSVSPASGGNWSNPSNWQQCGGGFPGSNDTVEITNGSPITLNQDATIQNITIDSGAVLDTDNNNRVLTLTTSGPLFTVASGGAFTPGNSTVVMNQNANGTVTLTAGTITFNNLQLTPVLSRNPNYTFGTGAITINGDFTIAPTRQSGTRTLTVNMSAAIIVLGTTTIQSNNSNITALLDTASNSLTSGQLNVGANGTLTANASAITLNGATGPLFTLNDTFNQGSSSVTMSSPNSVQLTAGNSITFDSLSVDMAGHTGTLGTDVVVNNRLLLVNGSFAVGANTLSLNGDPITGTPDNLVTTASSNLSFGGSVTGAILPASVAQLNNLTINNTNGLTLNGSPTINGTLNLANGAVTTGSNTLFASVSNCTAGKVQRTNGFVNGNLQLKFPAGSATCTFPVGTGTAYASVDVTTPTLSTGGMLTASTTGNEHPDITNSPIDPTKDANRYWTLSGDTINASTYDVTFHYAAGDADAAATQTNFIVGEKNGGSWTQPGGVTPNVLSTRSTAVSGPLTGADFSVGEVLFTCSVPAGMPSTMTCVCDNFGRSQLNPSTIYGGNWTLSSSSGSFGVPKIVAGALRLTDNTANDATAATMPGTFPAAGNLITVEFKHYAYNGTGADGIALTLSDATQAPTPGAYGGSLGYAQKDNASCATPPCNGFVGGWVGVGIDEFGNYSNPTEGRSGGPGAIADAVAVRGSGSGLVGYPYMSGTGSLSPGVDNPGTTTPSFGHAYRITVDARCYQLDTNNPELTCNNPSLAKKAQVTVNRDTSGAGSFSAANQLFTFDAYAANMSQGDVPANWKLSFTASTGGNTNIHEIKGLKICAQTITPPAGYRIEIDNPTPSTCGTPGGTPSSPIVTITALDTNGNTVATYNKTVSLSALLSGGGASNASWSLKSGNGTLTGNQYTFVAADQGVAKFYLTDANTQTVYVSASENGGTISSTLSTPVQFSGATFSITNIDSLAGNTAGGVVAGRAHLMKVTRTNGCSTNTAFTGLKNLDGWYTPATEHPSGASAPQICATNTNDPTTGTCSGSSGNTLGACSTLSIAAPTEDATSNFMPALKFSSGVATFCMASSDVGKYSISLRDDSSPTSVTGTSDVLTVRPFAVAVTDVKQGTTGNPASSGDASASGSLFATAGSSFQATIGGYLWNSAGDTDNDGKPDAGANKSQVTGGGSALHYADGITLGATSPYYPTPGTAGAVAGTLLPTTAAVTGGSSSAALTYSEVGSFTLSMVPGSNYLGSGVNLASRAAIFSNYGSSARTALIGRFKPDHFVLTNPSITNRATAGCTSSPFTYMGEPIGVGFKLEARNASGSLTQNYTLGWAALDTTDWLSGGATGSNNSVGLWMNASAYPYPGGSGTPTGTCTAVFKNDPANQNPTTFACTAGTSPLPSTVTRAAGARVSISGTPSAPSWSGGIGTFSANAVLERADTLDGPYGTVNIGVAPQDKEGVKLSSFDMDADNNTSLERASLGSTALRFGRLRLFNALGPAELDLPIPMRTEYWNGATFVTNTDDSCTKLPNPINNILLNNYIGGITSSNMPAGNFSAGGSFSSGVGSLVLKKPTSTPGAKGSVDVCVDLSSDPATPASAACALTSAGLPWLQGRWSSSSGYNYDPKIRATFGVYRGAPIIYLREMY